MEAERKSADTSGIAEAPPVAFQRACIPNSAGDFIPVEDDDSWFKARSVLALVSFWAFVTTYALRININLAIVEMVEPTREPHDNGRNVTAVQVCSNLLHHPPQDDGQQSDFNVGSRAYTSDLSQRSRVKFNWDEQIQTLILGSVYFGYVSTQLIGGRLAERLGGKMVFGLPLLCTGFFSILTPVAAKTSGYPGVVVLRILIGMCQGVSFPAMLNIIAHWVPPLERSRFSSMVFSGTSIGTIGTLALGGVVIDAWGWESIFYLGGAANTAWFVAWWFLAYNTPSEHPRISAAERQYLQSVITTSSRKEKAKQAVPWRRILTSIPFWSLVVAHMGSNYGYATLLTQLPTYMKNILHYDIKENGFLSSLPYITTFASALVYGRAMDSTIEKRWLSVTNVRKISNAIAQAGPALCLVAVAHVGCSRLVSVAFFCLAGLCQGCLFSGYLPNHVDLAPNFAGSLMGISNSAAAVASWTAPVVAGALTAQNQTIPAWQHVFWICAAIMIFDSVEFAIFASGEEQEWNNFTQSAPLANEPPGKGGLSDRPAHS